MDDGRRSVQAARCLSPIDASLPSRYVFYRAPESETLALQTILTERASPGRLLLLDEEQAFGLIERVEALPGGGPFAYRDTAGIRQLYLHSPDALADPAAWLGRYYDAPRLPRRRCDSRSSAAALLASQRNRAHWKR